MSRIGICLQCGQRYGDIPDSVTATRVKCRSCGGVVEIPPLAAAAPLAIAAAPAPLPPKPAPQPAAKPAAPVKPVIPAKPLAAPIKPVVPAKPLASPIRPVVPPKPLAAPIKPVLPPKPLAAPPQSVAPAKPAAAPIRPAVPPPPAAAKPSAAEILAAARAKRGAAPAAPAAEKPSPAEILAAARAKRVAAPAPVARSAPPAEVAGARRAPSAAPKRDAGEGKRSRQHGKPSGNRGPLLMVAVLLVAVGGAGGLWWMVQKNAAQEAAAKTATAGGPAAAQAAPSAQPVPDVLPALSVPEPAPAVPAGPPAAAEAPPSATETVEPPPAAAEQPVASATPAVDADFVFRVPAAGEAIDLVNGSVDPELIRLDQVPPLDKWQGTDDATWKEIQDDLALYLENSGARSNRAGDRLIAHGRHAFPAIVNGMMKQDYGTVDGVRMAGSLNDLLGKIGRGTNLGWRSAELHEIGSAEWIGAVLFQKKVTIKWQRQWVNLFSVNDAQWEAFAKKTTAKKGGEDSGVPPPPEPF